MRFRTALQMVLLAWVGLVATSCSNSPYPEDSGTEKVLYSAFDEAPRTLDPAVSYDTESHLIVSAVMEAPLAYHYLKRPYTLIPGAARAVPVAQPQADGTVVYRFSFRTTLRFADSPCFPEGRGRPIIVDDFLFQWHRLGDPEVNSPVAETFNHVVGFAEFSERLRTLAKEEPGFAKLSARERYARAGGIKGYRKIDDHTVEVVLTEPYPQILFWFSMPFTVPLPWEAVAYFDGQEGRPSLNDVAVATGPYRIAHYSKEHRISLVRNEAWHGYRPQADGAPVMEYPRVGEPGDEARGLLAPDRVGRPLGQIARVEFYREKDSLPIFRKFLQGYYDRSGIAKESFDKVVSGGRLTPEFAEKGITLDKSLEPGSFYIGFNMEDAVVGAPGGARSRQLRQAMSLALEIPEYIRIFRNGRGRVVHSVLPLGLFGGEVDYRNPYVGPDLERARALLEQAGFPGGRDPATGKPLHLTFTIVASSTQDLQTYQFFTEAWRQLGIEVELVATTFNQYQELMKKGSYQVFIAGWSADYPDPENFLFLFWSKMARSFNNGPNYACFADPEYDRLYESMRSRSDGPERLAEIRRMQEILAEERPLIELFQGERYGLSHGWLKPIKPFGMSNAMFHYWDLDPALRAQRREEWNRPIRWPLAVLIVGLVGFLLPAFLLYRKERH